MNQKWKNVLAILGFSVIPLILLLVLMYGQFSIVQSLLEDDHLYSWKKLSILTLSSIIVNVFYIIFLLVTNKKISVYYALLSIAYDAVLFYFFAAESHELLPWSVPRWMISHDIVLLVSTFLMPNALFCVYLLIKHFTPNPENNRAWINFIGALAIPAFIYLASQVIEPLINFFNPSYDFGRVFEIAIVLFLILITFVFFFFLLRAVYILVNKKNAVFQKFKWLWKIPITIIFPILGLLLNNGKLPFSRMQEDGIFGNFNNPWFYILAILNGIVLCIPFTKNRIMNLALFFLKSIGFAYTLYFFLVFLPFLPLSVILIVFFGAGILMLAPLVLFGIHLSDLWQNFKSLKEYFSKKYLILYFLVGFSIIPLSVYFSYYSDRITMHKTLEYVYTPDYSKDYKINTKKLAGTLEYIKYLKDNNAFRDFSSVRTPYLTALYNRLVLDNLILSDEKINQIERIFFNAAPRESSNSFINNEHVGITKFNTKSHFDEQQKCWISQVDLEISNQGDNWGAEYFTTFNLPSGAYISNYYLYVNGVKENGILAEKKSALWIFNSIRQVERDPGLLFYNNNEDIVFRIFPFTDFEVRKSGFEIIHKEAFQFQLDTFKTILGEEKSNNSSLTTFENENAFFVSKTDKEKLKKVLLQPYFHFIIDNSHSENKEKYLSSIQTFLQSYPNMKDSARYTLTNAYSTTLPFNELAAYSEEKNGGFNVDMALKKIFYNQFYGNQFSYPIIIVVSDSIQNAVIQNTYKEWDFTFKAKPIFYNLSSTNQLSKYSLLTGINEWETPNEPLTFNDSAYIIYSDDGSDYYFSSYKDAEIILKPTFNLDFKNQGKLKQWESAFNQEAIYRWFILHPKLAERNWVELVKASFESSIMNPYTSFIVVENDAQKQMLLKKQQQVLKGNKALDTMEDMESMSEPEMWIIAMLFLLILSIKNRLAIINKLKTALSKIH